MVYTRIIEILKKAYNSDKITCDAVLTLMNMLSDTAEHKLKDYSKIWKGVEEMLNAEYIPKWKLDLAKALEKNTEEVTEEVTTKVMRDTEIDMLRLMKKNGVPEKQIREIAKQKKISAKVVNDILGISKTKKAVGV